MSAGKGDTPRPFTLAIYHKNYDAIFRKQKLPSGYKPEIMPIADIECEECLEQARLLGMSAQRESTLRGKIVRLESALIKIAHGCDNPSQTAINVLDNWTSPFDSPDHDNDCDTYAERI